MHIYYNTTKSDVLTCNKHQEYIFMFIPFQVIIVAHVTARMANLTRHEEEKYFLTGTGEKELFPSLHDPYSRELSVVIPAYNEELRSEWQMYNQFSVNNLCTVICALIDNLLMSYDYLAVCRHSRLSKANMQC